MKKRICFAGFKGEELAALQAAAVTLTTAWECEFVADAAAAEAALARNHCDGIVADQHLPGRTGVELLHEAGEKYPKTLRFIVGEVADQSLIINGIGGVYQFIGRPFKAPELMQKVQRGLSLDAWLSSEALRKLAPRLRRLPSLPSTYFELLKHVEVSNADMQVIGEIIARDPVVTVRLLQMVNSAAFALVRKVTDPVDAVSLLGTETVKSLVLCLQVFSQTDEAKQAGVSLEELWAHSSKVGDIARQITLSETGDTRLANGAFTAGLLHDVGRIVLASNLPKEYAAVVHAARKERRPLHVEEFTQLGVTHAQVGAYLLGLWGMPAMLVEAAAAHHAPSQTSMREFSLLTAVHAANVFAHASTGKSSDLPLPEFDLDYFKSANLEDRPERWGRLLSGEPMTVPAPAPAVPATAPAVTRPARARETRSSVWSWLVPAGAAVVILSLLTWAFMASRSKPTAQARGTGRPSEVAVVKPPVVSETSASAEPVSVAESVPPSPPPALEVAAAPAEPKAIAPVMAAVEKSEVKPPAKSGFETLKVQGIFYRTANPLAVINGKSLTVGERINGVEVVAIKPALVTLAYQGQQRDFKVR